jgi:hypothetical protein
MPETGNNQTKSVPAAGTRYAKLYRASLHLRQPGSPSPQRNFAARGVGHMALHPRLSTGSPLSNARLFSCEWPQYIKGVKNPQGTKPQFLSENMQTNVIFFLKPPDRNFRKLSSTNQDAFLFEAQGAQKLPRKELITHSPLFECHKQCSRNNKQAGTETA